MNLLQQRDPEHLIATQPTTSPIAAAPLQEIVLDEFSDLRMRIQNPGHHLQLSGMLVRAPDGHERSLRFSELAHRFTPDRRFSV
jgi:hypothetical protein